jgi:hypothetical protein
LLRIRCHFESGSGREKSWSATVGKFILYFRKQKRSSHGSLLKRGHSIRESDPSEHPLVFTAQKPAAAIAPAHHITSGLRTPPSGIVAVRYGTVRHSSEAYTYLLLGALSPVLHVEGLQTVQASLWWAGISSFSRPFSPLWPYTKLEKGKTKVRYLLTFVLGLSRRKVNRKLICPCLIKDFFKFMNSMNKSVEME